MLLTIAAEENLPVNKFLSVRSKLGTVGRSDWCALFTVHLCPLTTLHSTRTRRAKTWRQELSNEQQNTRPLSASATYGRYGNRARTRCRSSS